MQSNEISMHCTNLFKKVCVASERTTVVQVSLCFHTVLRPLSYLKEGGQAMKALPHLNQTPHSHL